MVDSIETWMPDNEADFLMDIDRGEHVRVVSSLVAKSVICSNGDREPLRLSFPVKAAASWFPGLFPPK